MSNIAIELLQELSDLDNGAIKKQRLEAEVVPHITSVWVFYASDEGFQVDEIEVTQDQFTATNEGLMVSVECFGEERQLKVYDGGWGDHLAKVTMGVYGAAVLEPVARHMAEQEHIDQKRMFGSDDDED